jgi:hypothetical protein
MAGMADGNALKSSYELAIERLQKKDADAGVVRQPLTDAQKAAVADVRNLYEAKLAELDVLHRSRLRALVDPAEREAHEDAYRRDRERLTAERDRKVEQARIAL